MDTMRDRFARVATGLLDSDPRLAVVLADISEDLFEAAMRRHPDRVVNLGIREQLLISVAGGMSLAGIRPIAHTFASFLVERPFEQIKLDLNHQAPGAGAILVSSGASFDYSASGRTHQSPGDVALLGTLPGWTVHVPGHPDEAETLLRTAAGDDALVYLRLSALANTAPLARRSDGFTVLRRGARGDHSRGRPAGRRGDRGHRRDGCHRAVHAHDQALRPADAASDALGPRGGAGGALPRGDIGA